MCMLGTRRLILRRFIMDDLYQIHRLVYAGPRVKDAWSGIMRTPDEIKKRFATKYILPERHFGLRAVVAHDADPKHSAKRGVSEAIEAPSL
jgi:hypothetical protein